MARHAKSRVPFRRRREGKTKYRSRLALIKSGKPRLVIRRSLSKITVQFVTYKDNGDVVLAQATSPELQKMGWEGSVKNTPAAYLTGALAAKRALEGKVDSAVLDLGMAKPTRGDRVFAGLKGVLDMGIEVPHGDGMFPTDERISGSHLGDKVSSQFNQLKQKIEQG